jgi:hypothetical protein
VPAPSRALAIQMISMSQAIQKTLYPEPASQVQGTLMTCAGDTQSIANACENSALSLLGVSPRSYALLLRKRAGAYEEAESPARECLLLMDSRVSATRTRFR